CSNNKRRRPPPLPWRPLSPSSPLSADVHVFERVFEPLQQFGSILVALFFALAEGWNGHRQSGLLQPITLLSPASIVPISLAASASALYTAASSFFSSAWTRRNCTSSGMVRWGSALWMISTVSWIEEPVSRHCSINSITRRRSCGVIVRFLDPRFWSHRPEGCPGVHSLFDDRFHHNLEIIDGSTA